MRSGRLVEENDLGSKLGRCERGRGFRWRGVLVEQTDPGSKHAQKSDALCSVIGKATGRNVVGCCGAGSAASGRMVAPEAEKQPLDMHLAVAQ